MGNPFYGAIGAGKAGAKSQRGGGKRGIGSAHLYRGIGLNIVDAMKDPRWRKYMLRQVAILAGAVPGVGAFVAQVLNAMADNPKIDFSQVMAELFKVGVGKAFEMIATSAISGILPPGISPVLATIIKTGTSIGTMTAGKGLAQDIIDNKPKVDKLLRDARVRTEAEINKVG